MVNREGEVVCVTGGSGFIGSWIVHLLLRRGYTVHATVKNLGDEKETKHLEAMEGADSRLRLFQMDLLQYDSIVAAVSGAAGVIHVASPCVVDQVHDPQRELLEPAIRGTINVLTAAKELGVRRVVVTSSISAMVAGPNCMADAVMNEDCWADEEYCKHNGMADRHGRGRPRLNHQDEPRQQRERSPTHEIPQAQPPAAGAAWEFAEKNGLDIVVVNPGTVMGTIIPPAINASMLLTLRLLQGTEISENFFMGYVHVKDVALAHVLVYENTAATGRHLCVESLSRYDDFAAKIAELYPEYKVPRFPKDTQPEFLMTKDASKKLIDLGLEFVSLEQIVKDSVESLRGKGYLS